MQLFQSKLLNLAELTAKWEKRLNDIAEGKEDFETLVKNIENETRDWCKEIDNEEAKASFAGKNETEYKCPLCGEAVVKHSWGYGCNGYKDGCKFSISNTLAGKKLTDKQIDTLLSGKKTGVIKNFKSKTGKTFDAAIELTEEGKIKFVFDEKKSSGAKPESSGLMCPVCGNSLNHFGWGYGCSGYKDGCRFSISSKIAGREITEAEIKELLKNGKTKKLSGFTGKSGKPFEASLILDEFNKISFSFD